MSLFQKFLIFKRRLSGMLSDELQEAKEASFIELSLLLEKRVKRSLRPPELIAVWSMNDKQTEVITNILQEARNGEERGNQTDGRVPESVQGMPQTNGQEVGESIVQPAAEAL